MPSELIIYALVAAGLIFWLRSILGTRHGDERERPNPFTQHASDDTNAAAARREIPGSTGITERPVNLREGLERHMNIEGRYAESGLQDIVRADRSFGLPQFLANAQEAFKIIVSAFAASDKETLKELLDEQVYNSFSAAIDDRKAKGEKAEVKIHNIRRTDVIEASLKGEMAYITVRFVADETNVLYDKDDKVIAGNPSEMQDTADIWTFGRNINSRDPSWLLYETRDEDSAYDDHKTVPDH